jgi:signal transduction histidine kinase
MREQQLWGPRFAGSPPPGFRVAEVDRRVDAVNARTPAAPWRLSTGMTKHAVPMVAVLLASAAICGIVVLERHAGSSRNAQIRLSTTAGDLDALQGEPFHADPHDPAALGIPSAMSSEEAEIRATVSEFAPDASAALAQNFAALDRIYRWSAGGQVNPALGPRLADRSEATLAPVIVQLRERSVRYADSAGASALTSIVGSISMIVILLGGFFYYYQRSARVRRRERQAYAELDVAQAERKRLLVRTVEAAEDERMRIAGDLHDGPIQRLTAAAFTLDLLGRKLARGEHELDGLVVQVREQLSGEMESLRRLMSDLRPQLLDEGDVSAAIRDCAADLLGSETTCDVHDDIGHGVLSRDLETVVYRVAREAISNVQKHAHASHVDVTLAPDGESLRLTVVDNGAGFEPASAAVERLQHHLGLIAMQERVESVGGEWRIASSPGAGTRIDAILPWPPQASFIGRAGSGAHAAVA